MAHPQRRTGDSTERVNTRVLQIIYDFEPGDLPVYVGQQMDVFTAAPSLEAAILVKRMPQRSRPTTWRGES